MFVRPFHADGLGTSQLLLPSHIELCDDFLGFLLAKLKEKSQNNTKWIYSLCSIFDLTRGWRWPCVFAHKPISNPPFPEQFQHQPSYLEPLDGLFTGRAEDAVVQVGEGPDTTGQDQERGGGTHSCHDIGHCGEIDQNQQLFRKKPNLPHW